MVKHKNKLHGGWSIIYFILGLIDFGILLAIFLKGKDVALFNPSGLIAGDEHGLALLILAILLVIAIPTMFFFYFYAWKYRETNEKATYDPNTKHSKFLLFNMWAVPSVFMVVLSVIMWNATHKLEPQKALAANVKPITIQVVALRWKWLFIYPKQHIASVNFVQLPENTPVQFELTADDAPMSSFWIPHLGGQLYAMTGHVNRLNLMTETTGDYPGSSAEINGAGFAGMKFVARVSPYDDYDAWVSGVHTNSPDLDAEAYEKLLKPSESNPPDFYSLVDAGLYNKVVTKYMSSHTHQVSPE